MRRTILVTLIFVFSCILILTMQSCSTPTKDVISGDIIAYPGTLFCGIDTLKVRVYYYVPEDYEGEHWLMYITGDRSGTYTFSSDTLDFSNLQHYKDGKDTVLTWIGVCESSNQYYLTSSFVKVIGERGDLDSVGSQAGPMAVVNPNDPFTLQKWCGDGRYGNRNDTLMYPAAYAIYVQTKNQTTGIGVPGKYVTFSESGGELWYSQNTTIKASIPDGYEYVDGLAWTHLILPNITGNYTVTATCEGQSVIFDLTAVIDTETVSDDSLIHECWGDTTTSQISGDGYWGSYEPANNKKNIKLEVDYDNTVVSQNTLQSALNLLRDSLFSQIGIDVSYIIDDNFSYGNVYLRSQEKILLGQYGDSTGIGKGYLHVIFAKMFADSESLKVKGRAVTYRDPKWEKIGGTTCAYLGSGDLTTTGHSQYYLDSVGCMVYVRPSCQTIPDSFIDSAHVLALVAAHEIGHAIGLGHDTTSEYRYYGIMSYEIDFDSSYAKFAYFAKPKSLDYEQRWLINLRKVLGRETVDFMW